MWQKLELGQTVVYIGLNYRGNILICDTPEAWGDRKELIPATDCVIIQ